MSGVAPPIEPPPPAPPRPDWRPALIFAVWVVAIVASAVAALSLDRDYTHRRNPRTNNAYVGGDVTFVSARVPGYLKTLLVTDNQVVHAGDLIGVVEDDDYRADVDHARAALRATMARLDAIDAQQAELVAEIGETRSREQASIAAAGSTSPELARQERLIHTDAGVQRALDEAVANQKRTQASVAAAQAQRLVRERQIATLEAQRQDASAAVAAQKADLRLAELNLGWTRITAPVTGTLGKRLVRVGDLLAAGTRVVSDTPLDGVWVDANFNERQIPHIRVGQRASLRLDSFPGVVLAGQVAGLSPLTGGRLSALPPDNTTGNFTKVPARLPVRIAIIWDRSGSAARLRGLVRPGMSAVVTVLTGGAE